MGAKKTGFVVEDELLWEISGAVNFQEPIIITMFINS